MDKPPIDQTTLDFVLQLATEPTQAAYLDNGQVRLIRLDTEGNGHVRILHPQTALGTWDKTECHHQMREVYVVAQGQICAVEFNPDTGQMNAHLLAAGQTWSTTPTIAHTIYYFPDTDVHVLRVCAEAPDDTLGIPEFDDIAPTLNEETIFELCRLSQP